MLKMIKKPKPQDSITPDDYPEGSTFEYKRQKDKQLHMMEQHRVKKILL